MANRHLFVSYAREDAEQVLPIVKAVRAEFRARSLDVDVWVDMDELSPGQRWDEVITKALRDSIGLLIFISPVAMQSDWVTREISAALEHLDRLIIPVILKHVSDLPTPLARRQWLDLSGRRGPQDLERAVQQIADATASHLRAESALPPITSAEAPEIAATIAQEARRTKRADPGQSPQSVFLVHGHDDTALSEMEKYLAELGIKAVVLSRAGGPTQSLLQRFFRSAESAQFAIVILSPDDLGASCIQYNAEGVGDRALQFRARQNVILELGFFYGFLGWENVFVLYRPPEKVYPNFERPSDIEGAVFDSMDASGAWRDSLARKLVEAGFRL